MPAIPRPGGDKPVSLPRTVVLDFFFPPNTHEAYQIFSSVTTGHYAMILTILGMAGAHIGIFFGKGMNAQKGLQVILITSPVGYVPPMKNHRFREPTSPSLPSFLPCIQQIHFESLYVPGIVLEALGRWRSLPSLRIHAFTEEENNIIKK